MSAAQTAAVRAGRTATPDTPDLGRTWRAPADLPSKGRLGSVSIPGTASRFDARDALVYLPPAALAADPPPLPLDVVLSGQGPGAAPENLVDAGRMVETLAAVARAHHGFGGDRAAYDAAQPLAVLAARAPYVGSAGSSGHDWSTASRGLATGTDWLTARLGLTGTWGGAARRPSAEGGTSSVPHPRLLV